MKTYVVMLAGGTGSRMNAGINKILLPLCGVPVLVRSMKAFSGYCDEMAVACREDDEPQIRELLNRLSFPFDVIFARNGNTRQGSVLNGLMSLSSPAADDPVLIHDAARCLVSAEVISAVIESVKKCGSGIPGIPATSTFKVCGPDSLVSHTPDRASLYEIQTPQGFRAGTVIPAARQAEADHVDCTDDAGIMEHFGIPVKVVPGSPSNIKLTSPQDMDTARMILEGNTASLIRIGMGYDVHRLVPGRKLILCGVEIPFELGLLGHSDADVALHALMDAMLGACGLGDIGKHFPDTDEQFRGISSMELLERTNGILKNAGYMVNNLDITIVAQKPKLLSYIPQMVANIAEKLSILPTAVSVKATTTETLGFEGRMEGISSQAVCSVVFRNLIG